MDRAGWRSNRRRIREGWPGSARGRDPRGDRSLVRDPLPGALGRRPREHDPALRGECPDHPPPGAPRRRIGAPAPDLNGPPVVSDPRAGLGRALLAAREPLARQCREARPGILPGHLVVAPVVGARGVLGASDGRLWAPDRGPGSRGAVLGSERRAARSLVAACPFLAARRRATAGTHGARLAETRVAAARPDCHRPVLGRAQADRLRSDGAIGREARHDLRRDRAARGVARWRAGAVPRRRRRARSPCPRRRLARSGRSGGCSPRGPSASRS